MPEGAPLTTVLVAASVVATLIAASDAVSSQVYLDSGSQVSSGRQAWRLLTSLFPFESLPEALLGLSLLFQWGRTCERLMGRSKFALFAALATLCAVLSRAGLALAALPAGASVALGPSSPSAPGAAAAAAAAAATRILPGGGPPHSWLRTGLASGPYHLVFGLLPLVYMHVPPLSSSSTGAASYYFKVGPLAFTDKGPAYAMALVLAACTGPRSAIAAAYSLAFGLLYALPGPGKGLQALAVPRSVRQAVGAVVMPLLGDSGGGSTPVLPPGPPGPPHAGGRGRGGNGTGAAAAAPPAANSTAAFGPEALEALQRLVDMGFPRNAAAAALTATGGDADAAAALLLTGA